MQGPAPACASDPGLQMQTDPVPKTIVEHEITSRTISLTVCDRERFWCAGNSLTKRVHDKWTQFYIKPSLMLEPTTFVAEVADEGRATGGGGEGEEVLLLCPALAWSPEQCTATGVGTYRGLRTGLRSVNRGL